MATPITNYRFGEDTLSETDETRRHMQRRTRSKVSGSEAVRVAIHNERQRLEPEIAADVGAWSELLRQVLEAGHIGDLEPARIVLRGTGHTELDEAVEVLPSGAVSRIPARWETMTAQAFLGGFVPGHDEDAVALDLQLLVEHHSAIGATVFLTGEAGLARVYLGTLSLLVGDDALDSSRLSAIAEENGFDWT
ncbi:MAG: hypothetical protein WKF94_03700 [Solirubrobacteraceae bacterium]